jgi:hypothetical protein
MKLPPLVVGHNHAVIGVKPEQGDEIMLMVLKLTITPDPTDPAQESVLEISLQPENAESLGRELVQRAQRAMLLRDAQKHGRH